MLLERLWRFRLAVMVTSVGALAAYLRFVNLKEPASLAFDELYYARGAYSLLHLGFEGVWGGANQDFAGGDFSHLESRPDNVVHPPFGKWLIAAGIQLFGATPAGWRIASAFFGTLTVVLIALIARRLFRSTLWGGVAGLFLAIDGQHIVQSRHALLDIFLTFFVVVAFALLIADRDRARARLRAGVNSARERLGLSPDDPLPGMGPTTGLRFYRWAALVSLGLATCVKWSGLYFAAAFMILSVLWDLIDRREAGVRDWIAGATVRSAAPAFVALVLLLPLAYVGGYASWFDSDSSYKRHWAEGHPGEGHSWLPESARSFVEYHGSTYRFHENLTGSNGVTHSYAANEWGLIIQLQPTAYYYHSERDSPPEVCGADECTSAIHGIGNPLLWWAGAAALGFALYRIAWRSDMLAATVIIGTLAGWIPWLIFADRIIFTFYSVAFAPWVMLTLTWALREIAQPERLRGAWSRTGGLVVGAFVAVALIITAFFWPVLTGQLIPHDYWEWHMWGGIQWIKPHNG